MAQKFLFLALLFAACFPAFAAWAPLPDEGSPDPFVVGLRESHALRRTAHYAHGVVMTLALVVLVPLGVILPRLLRKAHPRRIHVLLSICAIVFLLVGLCTGIWLAYLQDSTFRTSHQLSGVLIVVLYIVAGMFSGLYAYLRWRFFGHRDGQVPGQVRYEGPSWSRNIHVWFGRGLFIAGAIVGGLGVQRSLPFHTTNFFAVGYWTLTFVMACAYIFIHLKDFLEARILAQMLLEKQEREAQSGGESAAGIFELQPINRGNDIQDSEGSTTRYFGIKPVDERNDRLEIGGTAARDFGIQPVNGRNDRLEIEGTAVRDFGIQPVNRRNERLEIEGTAVRDFGIQPVNRRNDRLEIEGTAVRDFGIESVKGNKAGKRKEGAE